MKKHDVITFPVTGSRQAPRRARDSGNGFALVACLMMMVLLLLIAVGLLGLSSIELRKSAQQDFAATARANARLALLNAIGQLQKTAGPDQRVTATAEILGNTAAQPHWTGVWRSTRPDGSSYMVRDDLNGGLKDTRSEGSHNPAGEVMEWLVSGEQDASAIDPEERITLMQTRSSGSNPEPAVEVSKVKVATADGKPTGNYAWWTGDLGVRANIATKDPRSDIAAIPSSPADGGLYRVMASQAAEMSMMSGEAQLAEDDYGRLATAGTTSLTEAGPDWSNEHAFDFTVNSRGVLADVASGGLKRDLTAYFSSGGTVHAADGLGGLSDEDSLVGVESDQNKSTTSARHILAGPRFGLLRNWATSSVPFSGSNVPVKLPEMDTSSAATSRTMALANETAVKLSGNRREGLQPVLVEATNFTQMACHFEKMLADPTQPAPIKIYQLRTLMYPRVVLWNPYNIDLQVDRLIIMIQGNGRQEMWTKNTNINGLRPPRGFQSESAWINFEGGRNISFGTGNVLGSEAYKDPFMGSYYFVVPATSFKPGECLVFSPPGAAEYDGLSVYRPGAYNLNSNVLSCEVTPDPSRCYYVSGSDLASNGDGGMDFLPTEFWYAPTPVFYNGKIGILNQADDTRVIVKSVGSATHIDFATFDALPQVAVVSASLQYGAGKEPRVAWSKYNRMPMQLLDRSNPHPTVIPDVRTRESVRLRWFDEHPSNLQGSGPLAGTAHFQDAVLANWNPRASYILRSPWENIAGTLPSGGSGGPWFFGAYTRDLYDQAVSWQEQTPTSGSGGKAHGNPFGPPQEGSNRYVLFDVPRNETGIISIAQLQHAKISDLIWHPSNAIGNSLADPRLGGGGNKGLNRTAAVGTSSTSAALGGFAESEIGWSSDTQRSNGRGEWATTARAILGQTPSQDNLVYDLSFEANRSLWDRYFFSSGIGGEKQSFLDDPESNPLPNGRMQLAATTRSTATYESLSDFHRAAYQLMVDGAFNVNSTRVEAWKALLASTRSSGYSSGAGTPFPRMLNAPGGAWKTGDAVDGDKAWAGYRVLTDGEINSLAEAIVEEVKLRGPFISLADFVNRRLTEDSTGRMGALQAAIERAELNKTFTSAYPLNNSSSLPNYKHPDNIGDSTGLEQTLKPSSKAWGATSYLTQADVLQVLGPALSARSDTFVIRTYGDAVDAAGTIQARAWCEAVIQRTPEPLTPDTSGINPANANQPGDFGRRFVVSSFRWLSPEEI